MKDSLASILHLLDEEDVKIESMRDEKSRSTIYRVILEDRAIAEIPNIFLYKNYYEE